MHCKCKQFKAVMLKLQGASRSLSKYAVSDYVWLYHNVDFWLSQSSLKKIFIIHIIVYFQFYDMVGYIQSVELVFDRDMPPYFTVRHSDMEFVGADQRL